MATRLEVLSEYRNRDVYYKPGMVIEVDEALAAWLMVDAPGCFAAEGKAIEAPPVDKMVKRPAGRKSTKGL